jgi:dienelactone hydrolase
MRRLTRLVDRVRGRAVDPPVPDATGFYRAAPAGDGPQGEVLAAEPIDAPDGSRGWRIRYRTRDAAGHSVAASMALAAPAGATDRGRPVVAWIHGAVGVAPGCGPSRTGLVVPYASELLAAGVVVAAPDLTGLGVEGVAHPYLHGTTAGSSILDALRAAADFADAGAGAVTAVAGHSAGGHAVLWANQLAGGEAGAGLDVRLALAFAPVTDMGVAIPHYASAIGHGAFAVQVAATWPGTEPVATEDVLTAAGRDRLGALEASCLGGVMEAYPGDPARWLRADGFRSGAWARALAEQSAGRAPGRAPTVVLHGSDDGSVLPAWSDRFVTESQRAGGDVELRIVRGAGHNEVIDHARREAVELLVGAVAGSGG